MTQSAAVQNDSFEANFRQTLHANIDRAVGKGDYQELALFARRGYAGQAVIEKLLELAQAPDAPVEKIQVALGRAGLNIGDLSYPMGEAAEGRGERQGVRAALVNALDYLGTQNDPEAHQAINHILRSTKIYTPLQIEVMAVKGNDRAVPLIEHYGEEYEPDQAEQVKKKLKMLQIIDTPAAIAAVGRIADNKNHGDIGIKTLKSFGERAVPALEGLSKSTDPYHASWAFGAIKAIEGDTARAAEERIKVDFAARLQRLDKVATELLKISRLDVSESTKGKLQAELLTEPGETEYVRPVSPAGTAAAVYAEVNVPLAISALDKLGKLNTYQATEYLLHLGKKYPEHRAQAYTAFAAQASAYESISLRSAPKNVDEAREVLPYLVSMNVIKDEDLAEFLKRHPKLEDELLQGADPTQNETFLMALRLEKTDPRWLPILFESYKQVPTESKTEALTHYGDIHQRQADDLMDLFDAVPEPHAVAGIFFTARNAQNWGEAGKDKSRLIDRAILLLTDSAVPEASKYLATLGSYYPEVRLPVLNGLIQRKYAASDEAAARVVSDAALPLLKTMSSPAQLYKNWTSMKPEGRTALAQAFASADQAVLLPNAPGFLTSVYEGVASNIAQRAAQKVQHKAVFPEQANDP